MYDFVEMKDHDNGGNELPSVAMKFDGVYLENEIEGYRTLAVTGRELLGYNVDSTNVSGMDGSRFIGAYLPSRILNIKYMMEADDAEDLRFKYNQMNQLLRTKQAVISFLDEPEYEFIGTLSQVSEVPEGRLTIVSTFDIMCADPHKYKVAESISGVGTLNVDVGMEGDIVPSELIIQHSSASDVYEIVNEDKDLKIRLINASESSADIRIYPATQDIVRSGMDRPELLDWTSDLENFEIENGDVISISPTDATLTIKIRERLR